MSIFRPSSPQDGAPRPEDAEGRQTTPQEEEWAQQYLSQRAAIVRGARMTRVSWQRALKAGVQRAADGDASALRSAYRATVDYHRFLDRQMARLGQLLVPAQFDQEHRALLDEIGRIRRAVLTYEQAVRPGFVEQYGHADERCLRAAQRMLSLALGDQQPAPDDPEEDQPE